MLMHLSQDEDVCPQDPALEEGVEEAEQRMQPGTIKHAVFHVSALAHIDALLGTVSMQCGR